MLLRLFLLFTVVPLIELALLIWIGSKTSVLFTVALVIGTGMLGAALARAQGLETWRRLRQKLAAGQLPTDSALDGMMILIAAALLLTPGLLTDLAGFALLIPPVRWAVRRRLGLWLKRHLEARMVVFRGDGTNQPHSPSGSVTDVEFTRRTDGESHCS